MSNLPTQMRQVEISTPGGPEVLVLAQGAVPQPGLGEVLIQVAAAGVNRPDVVQRQGKYPPPKGASPLPGLEVAGHIAALGSDVTGWALGDPVCALLPGGGYAEYALAPAPQCLPIPAGLSLVEAAALPETAFTVWHNVFQRGKLAAGESLLVHGGTSGIGTLAIQLAHARGARVFTTAGSDAKCAACVELGADFAINYKTQDFVEVVKRVTEGKGVQVVLDMVGGDYFARNMSALCVEGRLVQIAFLQGSQLTLDLMPLMVKRLTLMGSTMRHRPVAEKAAIARGVQEYVWPLVEAGKVKPVIQATFPLEQAAEAHRQMEASNHIGKLVLVMG